MSADTNVWTLVRQLDQENKRRMEAIEKRLDEYLKEQTEQGKILTRIDANVSGLPNRVEDLEKKDHKRTGGMIVLSVIWGGALALIEALRK